jgi:hypothetical protein
MNDIYSLFKNDPLMSKDEILSALNRISENNVFDSKELLDYLDAYTRKAPRKLVEQIKAFQKSTMNLDLKMPEIKEIALN